MADYCKKVTGELLDERADGKPDKSDEFDDPDNRPSNNDAQRSFEFRCRRT